MFSFRFFLFNLNYAECTNNFIVVGGNCSLCQVLESLRVKWLFLYRGRFFLPHKKCVLFSMKKKNQEKVALYKVQHLDLNTKPVQ